MVLTSGAQREKYLSLEFKGLGIEYVYNKKTKEKFEDKLELYYLVYDENHTPLDKPEFDYPNNYIAVVDGVDTELIDVLERIGHYRRAYAVISNHNKIVGIEYFKVNSHDKFYSIEINKYTANVLTSLGLNNIVVNENLGDYYLPRIQIRNGFELLHFISCPKYLSADTFLYNIRTKLLTDNLFEMITAKKEQGLLLPLDDGNVYQFTNTLKDKIELEKSLNLELNSLVNNGKAYIVTQDDLKNINFRLNKNDGMYDGYYHSVINSDDLEPIPFEFNKHTNNSHGVKFTLLKDKYLNKYDNELYMLTMPNVMNKVSYQLLDYEKDREISISKDIAIVTTLQDDNHLLLKQLQNNNVLYYKTTEDKLYETLKKINKKYTLVVKQPSVIVNDLTDSFIDKFLSLDAEYIFSGSNINNLNNINYLGCDELCMGDYRYLNDSVMFGYTTSIVDFYSTYKLLNNDSRQSLISAIINFLNKRCSFINKIDSKSDLFYDVNFVTNQIREADGYKYVYELNTEERRLF